MKITEQMRVLAAERGLISHYTNDLGHDIEMIETKPHGRFLWLPYDVGSHMIRLPCQKGLVETIYGGFQGINAFEIRDGKLREVTMEQAIDLAREHCLAPSEAYSQVSA